MTHIATDPELGVRSPKRSKVFAIVNPTNVIRERAVSIQTNSNVYKNWPLGHGKYRISGNLGPLMQKIRLIKENGYNDVLWMIDDYVKEMNVCNVFVLWKSRFGKLELLTPPDDGCIFNGLTRRSIIELKDKIKLDKGVDIIERNVSIHEILGAHEE
jgi:branched-chain amino acid aminotransferase